MILKEFDTVVVAFLFRVCGCNDIGVPFDYLAHADDAHLNVSCHAKDEAARAMM